MLEALGKHKSKKCCSARYHVSWLIAVWCIHCAPSVSHPSPLESSKSWPRHHVCRRIDGALLFLNAFVSRPAEQVQAQRSPCLKKVYKSKSSKAPTLNQTSLFIFAFFSQNHFITRFTRSERDRNSSRSKREGKKPPSLIRAH